MHWLYHIVRHALVNWGYWAVFAALIAEDAGLPVPGETTLMFASFLAHKSARLHIEWLILAGVAAAITGDNIGFLLGRHRGKTLIRWMRKLLRRDDDDMGVAREQIRLHGGATVFWARYIFGLRTIAGPLAGMLGMEWKRFFLFNALGAITWVTVISLTAFAFAREFQTLMGFFEKVSWGIAGAIFVIGYIVWRKKTHRYKEHKRSSAA